MQLHCLHANSFVFETRTREPESDTVWGQTDATVENCLVVFVAVERGDGRNRETLISKARTQIEDVAEQLGESTVVLVPFEQLSDRPADGAEQEAVFRSLEAKLSLETYTVGPGYDLEFTLDARGHPFASQHFRIEAKRRRADSEWFVTNFDREQGLVIEEAERGVAENESNDRTVKKGSKRTDDGPALFDTGPDGERRVLPAGILSRDLLVEFAQRRLGEYGAVTVERHPDGSGPHTLTDLFGVTDLGVEELPVSIYSSQEFGVSKDSTTEKSLQLATLLSTTEGALDEIVRQAALMHGSLEELELEYEPLIRTTERFYESNTDWLAELLATFDRPVLIERLANGDEQYFELEFVVSDGDGNRLVAPSVRFEGEFPGMTLAEKEHPLVVRSKPLDSPLRILAAMIERLSTTERPQLPVWLSPVQLRLIPIESEHVPYCERLAATFETARIRVDIDDRDEPVSTRLARADTEWVPYDVVVGDEEVESETLGVYIRAEQVEKPFSADELRERIRTETEGLPRSTLPLTMRHSQRPGFLDTG